MLLRREAKTVEETEGEKGPARDRGPGQAEEEPRRGPGRGGEGGGEKEIETMAGK